MYRLNTGFTVKKPLASPVTGILGEGELNLKPNPLAPGGARHEDLVPGIVVCGPVHAVFLLAPRVGDSRQHGRAAVRCWTRLLALAPICGSTWRAYGWNADRGKLTEHPFALDPECPATIMICWSHWQPPALGLGCAVHKQAGIAHHQ